MIRSLLVTITNSVSTLDKNLILRNRSIDPRFQFELYQSLSDAEHLILPPFPEHSKSFYHTLEAILELIAKYLLRERGKSYLFYSNLGYKWITESPYREIVEDQIKFRLGKKSLSPSERKREVNEVIEDLDDAIETRLRYDYTRGLKCYCDIVELILSTRHEEPMCCLHLPSYLEAGVSSEPVLFLIGAGLSRNAALEVSQALRVAGGLPEWTTVAETLGWLKKNKHILEHRIDPVLYKEIDRLTGE
jgi:hypothetical protein